MKYQNEIEQLLLTKNIKYKITPETQFKDLGLDSLDLMDLIIKAEEIYKIQIPDQELINMKTINDLNTALEKLIK